MDDVPAADSSSISEDLSGLRTYTSATLPYLRRLERLVRMLVGIRFGSAQQIWQMQLDLLRLQWEIQKEIGSAKKLARRDEAIREDLGSFRVLRWQARRLGDALAWLLLGDERHAIYSLAQNGQVAIGQDDHGSRGMLVIAEVLANKGLGFPIIHDVTDYLRIGDISFIKRNEKVKTLEVKTHLVDSEETEGGMTRDSYQVTVLSASDFHVDVPDLPDTSSMEGSETPSPRLIVPSPRISRQLRRMGMAKAYQEAMPDTLSDFDNKPFMSTVLLSSASGDWEAIRKLVGEAEKMGYASKSVDDTFLYAAFYHPEGLEKNDIVESRILQDLTDAGILFKEGEGRNEILICGIPQQEQKAPQLYLPYFLYPLPEESIINLLRGQLFIMVVVHRGRIAKSLEMAGYTVTYSPEDANSCGRTFVVSADIVMKPGVTRRISLHNIEQHVEEMIYEFRPVRYLSEVAAKMSGAAKAAFLQEDVG